MRQVTAAQKVEEAKALEEKVEAYKREEEAKRLSIKKKNVDHQQLMLKQVGTKQKGKDLTLCKTGVAIIKGESLM